MYSLDAGASAYSCSSTVPSMTSPPPSVWAKKFFVIYFLFFLGRNPWKDVDWQNISIFPTVFHFLRLKKKIKCTSFSRFWLKNFDLISELALHVWQAIVASQIPCRKQLPCPKHMEVRRRLVWGQAKRRKLLQIHALIYHLNSLT